MGRRGLRPSRESSCRARHPHHVLDSRGPEPPTTTPHHQTLNQDWYFTTSNLLLAHPAGSGEAPQVVNWTGPCPPPASRVSKRGAYWLRFDSTQSNQLPTAATTGYFNYGAPDGDISVDNELNSLLCRRRV